MHLFGKCKKLYCLYLTAKLHSRKNISMNLSSLYKQKRKAGPVTLVLEFIRIHAVRLLFRNSKHVLIILSSETTTN